MFRIEMFPAREGDCLIVTYGDQDTPRRILIDGGRKATYADLKKHLRELPDDEREFELLIVSHVDRDHIEGVLKMFKDADLPITFKDVWFNAYHHLNSGDIETFSAVQGEKLTEALVDRVKAGEFTWNGEFGDDYEKAAALPADDSIVIVPLKDGMSLTLLSPSREKMFKLIDRWEDECRNAGMLAGQAAQDPPPEGFETFSSIDIDALADMPFKSDKSEPNGSSIAVLATYNGKSALLSGDAHVDCLEASIQQLAVNGDKPTFDAFKVPHHGSRKNVSKSLLQSFNCRNYLISTSGSYFDHPDPVAMSRIIKYGGSDTRIWFNYRSDETEIWDVPSWKQDHDYSVHYPDNDTNGYQVIDLESP